MTTAWIAYAPGEKDNTTRSLPTKLMTAADNGEDSGADGLDVSPTTDVVNA